mgnify:CR=1 FL=1
MIIESCKPVVSGHFDAEKARGLARKLILKDQRNRRNGTLPTEAPLQNLHLTARGVAVAIRRDILHEISLTLKPQVQESNEYIIRVQNAADSRQINGSFWHDDGVAFRIGYSDFPTEFVVGNIDITAVLEQYSQAALPYLTRQQLINRNPLAMSECVDAAIACGTAEIIDPFPPGTLLDVPQGVVHRSAVPPEIAEARVTVPRLLISTMLDTM